jgi:sec-independent protein translocase protein TatC
MNRREPNPDKRMELTEHLGELRTRILRSLMYLVVGAIIAYQFFTPIYAVLNAPLAKETKIQNEKLANTLNGEKFELPPTPPGEPTREDYEKLRKSVEWLYNNRSMTSTINPTVFRTAWEPFMLRLTMSIIFGFVLVSPLVLWELGQFIAPALTPQERRPMRLMLPISAAMMLSGVSVAYFTMFYAMGWFLSYMADFPPPNTLMQSPNDYIMFFVKMMAVFGLAFQLPVVLTAGAFVGIVTSKGLVKGWRYGVLLSALSALFIPTNDIVSMIVISSSIFVLYFGSIILVKIVERMKAKQKKDDGK